MSGYDFERPYVPHAKLQKYRVTNVKVAREYGQYVLADAMSNVEYKTRYERLARANNMKKLPSCGRIFPGYLAVRKLGTKHQYETWIPEMGFEDDHELYVGLSDSVA